MKKANKIYIIGTMGSGKTTLSKKLSEILEIKHYPLDNIYYKRKYDKKRKENERKKKLNELLKKKKWIIEGVFNNWTGNIFRKAELVIWLDLNPKQIIKNLFKRLFKKEDEKASLRNIKGSMKYAIKYRKNSKKFIYHKSMIKKHRVNLIHLKTKRELNNFLKEVEALRG